MNISLKFASFRLLLLFIGDVGAILVSNQDLCVFTLLKVQRSDADLFPRISVYIRRNFYGFWSEDLRLRITRVDQEHLLRLAAVVLNVNLGFLLSIFVSCFLGFIVLINRGKLELYLWLGKSVVFCLSWFWDLLKQLESVMLLGQFMRNLRFVDANLDIYPFPSVNY